MRRDFGSTNMSGPANEIPQSRPSSLLQSVSASRRYFRASSRSEVVVLDSWPASRAAPSAINAAKLASDIVISHLDCGAFPPLSVLICPQKTKQRKSAALQI